MRGVWKSGAQGGALEWLENSASCDSTEARESPDPLRYLRWLLFKSSSCAF